MKTRTLIIGALATLATVAAPMAASAQSGRGDRDRDGRYERWERRADQNRRDGGGYTRNERSNDWRRGQRDQYRDSRYRQPYAYSYSYSQPYSYGYSQPYSYGYSQPYSYGQVQVPRRWYRGATIPYDYRSRWYVRDYHRYGYGAPPRGYGYYRTDAGDVVLAAIATGVILSLLN